MPPVRLEEHAPVAVCRFSTREVPGMLTDLSVDGLTDVVELVREGCGIGER